MAAEAWGVNHSNFILKVIHQMCLFSYPYIDGIVQDDSNSSTLTMELLKYCAQASIGLCSKDFVNFHFSGISIISMTLPVFIVIITCLGYLSI